MFLAPSGSLTSYVSSLPAKTLLYLLYLYSCSLLDLSLCLPNRFPPSFFFHLASFAIYSYCYNYYNKQESSSSVARRRSRHGHLSKKDYFFSGHISLLNLATSFELVNKAILLYAQSSSQPILPSMYISISIPVCPEGLLV